VRKAVSNCKTCAEVKPRYYRSGSETLIKAIRPMECFSLDFKDRFRRQAVAVTCWQQLMSTSVRIWQRQQSNAVSISSLPCVERQDLFIPIMGQPLCLAISRSTCFGGALSLAPVVFIIRLERGRPRKLLALYGKQCTSWNRVVKPRTASIALGSCFRGFAAFGAVVIMHCYKHYPSWTFL